MPHNGAVLVIGATGQQRGAVARHLLDRGRPVRALVRDPGAPAAQALRRRGAFLVEGALDDAPSVRGALAGVDAAFLMLTPADPDGVAGEERRGKQVADLVRELGIAHLVYSSVLSHLAILAREARVATVVGYANATQDLAADAVVVVNGETGQVTIDPQETTS
jgi:uncharacterized protein YbjT (DUF2867 family)